MTQDKDWTQDKPRIGISSCLLGDAVRYNGAHKRDKFVTEELTPYVTWLPVCPEVGIGLGIPRETIQLVRSEDGPRLVGSKSREDHTEKMNRFADVYLRGLALWRPHGYILKKKSPSCGMERIPVYKQDGNPETTTSGLFVQALKRVFHLLPMEEEGRLHDLKLRAGFLERVYAYKRWCDYVENDGSPGGLVDFHTRHKLMLMAYEETRYRALGRLVASAGREDLSDLIDRYGNLFMETLAKGASARRHANVLYHVMGFLKDKLSTDEKSELVDCVERYRKEKAPLSVPLTLLGHHFRRHPHPWVESQVYLEPYPRDFLMRHYI